MTYTAAAPRSLTARATGIETPREQGATHLESSAGVREPLLARRHVTPPAVVAPREVPASSNNDAGALTAAALKFLKFAISIEADSSTEVQEAALLLQRHILSSTARAALEQDQAQVAYAYARQLAGYAPALPPLELVPDHVPLPQELRSAAAWVAGQCDEPTLFAARQDLKAQMREALGCERTLTPSISNPEELHLGTDMASAQNAPPLRFFSGQAPPGHALAFNALAILKKHSEHCSTCAATYLSPDFEAWASGVITDPWLPGGGKCYSNAMVSNATNHFPSWAGEPPATLVATSAEEPEAIDSSPQAAALEAQITKLIAKGVISLTPPGEQVLVSKVFLVHKATISLTEEEEEAINDRTPLAEGGTQGARAAWWAATERSDAVMASMKDSNHFDTALHNSLEIDGGRMVIDLHAVNAAVPAWRYHIAKVPDLLSFCIPGSWIFKMDVKGGYYHVRLNPEARKYFAFIYRGQTYWYHRLPMGYAPAGAIFGWITSEVNRWLRRAGVRASIVYIDDFMGEGHTKEEALFAMDLLKAFCKLIDCELNEAKEIGPAQRVTLLGLEVDTIANTIAIPAAALAKTLFKVQVALRCSIEKRQVPVRFLESLAGAVTWLATVNSLLRPFTHPLTDMISSHHRRRGLCYISTEATRALEFITQQAADGRIAGESLLPSFQARRQLSVTITSDACGAGRFAAKCGLAVLYGTVAGGDKIDIVLLELLAVVAAVARWGPFMPGAIIMTGVDNSGVAHWLNAGRCARRASLQALCVLFGMLESNKQILLARWLSRWFNHLTDRVADSATITEARVWAPSAFHMHITSPQDSLNEWARSAQQLLANFNADVAWR